MTNKQKSIERFIDRVDTVYSEEWDKLPVGPMPDENGNIKMNYQEFRKFVHNRTRLSYCQGVYRTMVYL